MNDALKMWLLSLIKISQSDLMRLFTFRINCTTAPIPSAIYFCRHFDVD